MSKIAILTDSSCDIPQELAEKYGIDIMGFHILLDDVDYVERESCTNIEFYDKMRAAKGIPSTAAITPIQFCEQYCKYVDEGYTDVIHVPINKLRLLHLQQRRHGAGNAAGGAPGAPPEDPPASTPTPTPWCSAGTCVRWPASCATARRSAMSSHEFEATDEPAWRSCSGTLQPQADEEERPHLPPLPPSWAS